MRVTLSVLALAALLLAPSVAAASAGGDADIDRVICGVTSHAEAAILSPVADDIGVADHTICPLSRSERKTRCPMGSGAVALMNCCCFKGASSRDATESTFGDRSNPSVTLTVSLAASTESDSLPPGVEIPAADRIDGLDTPPPERRLLSL